MKSIVNIFLYLDIFVAIVAAAVPEMFVNFSSNTVMRLIDSHKVGSVAYGIVLILIVLIFSFVRESWFREDGSANRPSVRKILFGFPVLLVGYFVIIEPIVTRNTQLVAASAVTEPYASYLLSIIFCMGIGYVLVDFINFVFYFFKGDA